MRLPVIAAVFLAIASAFMLYGLNYETRRLEARVQAQERTADAARGDISVLKAERAHLARPDRIEPAARALGLRPITERQFTANAEEAAVPPPPSPATPTLRQREGTR